MVIQTSRQRLKNNMQNAKDKNNYVWVTGLWIYRKFLSFVEKCCSKTKS